jgi:hypothetical protein
LSLFGDKAFKEVTRFKCGHVSWTLLYLTDVLIRRRRDTWVWVDREKAMRGYREEVPSSSQGRETSEEPNLDLTSASRTVRKSSSSV